MKVVHSRHCDRAPCSCGALAEAHALAEATRGLDLLDTGNYEPGQDDGWAETLGGSMAEYFRRLLRGGGA
jgi:hypothetical protein